LSALLGGLGTYFGAHIGTKAIDTSSAASLSSQTSAEQSMMKRGASGSSHDSGSSKFVTYVVKPNDTIGNLCKMSLGRYDATVITELRKLNPNLTDVDRIEVGQQIRLPVRPSN
jgi:hypothetical protein